jgi:hypothetical protein
MVVLMLHHLSNFDGAVTVRNADQCHNFVSHTGGLYCTAPDDGSQHTAITASFIIPSGSSTMTPVRDFQDKEELTRFVEYCEDDFDYSDSSTDKREQSLLKRLVKPWSLYIFFIHFILIFAISLLWIRPFHSVGTYPDQSQDSWCKYL